MESTTPTRERAIAGVTHGIIGPNQTVTWRGRHFGLMLEHTSLIDRYDPPHYFRDIMVKGHFRSFEHEHYFEPTKDGGTTMRDRLHFAAQLPPLGWFAERFILRSYLTRFLQERNAAIKRIAASAPGDSQRYLDRRNLTRAL
jgi:ligand-binding SRPBCC domain-containing protein